MTTSFSKRTVLYGISWFGFVWVGSVGRLLALIS